MGANRDLIDRRIAKVAALLKETGQQADKIHELLYLKSGERKAHYRKMRKVALIEGHKKDPGVRPAAKKPGKLKPARRKGRTSFR